MARPRPWGSALLLLALLFPLVLPLDAGREALDSEAPAAAAPGAASLPLIQMLLSQATPRSWPHGRGRRRASGQPLRYMRDLYWSLADRHGRPRRDWRLSGNTIRLVRPSAKARQAGTGSWFIWALDYHLQVQSPAQHLVRAAVVYAQWPSSPHGPLWCTASLLPGRSAPPWEAVSPALLKDATTKSALDSWVEMDLSSSLQPWTWAAQKSHLLRLHHVCIFLGWAQGSPPGPGWGDPPSLEDPFLLLYLNDTQKPPQAALGHSVPFPRGHPRGSAHAHRTRRADALALDFPSYSRTPSVRHSECALHPFRVSFRQLGWDHWIIAPHWYRPQFCKGGCPRVLRYGYHSPNHAIVQNLINELVDQHVPRPSCVPHEYSPISVLMIEQNNNILYKVYEDMIAKSCTCR
ncbi:bone morphogenetic protein 15 [Candoia aspera]|uniref:bone morphogenetic protein 15 n=1 Tax=Candoia aspera TaxID=51853 RepID=UPI002FD7EF12